MLRVRFNLSADTVGLVHEAVSRVDGLLVKHHDKAGAVIYEMSFEKVYLERWTTEGGYHSEDTQYLSVYWDYDEVYVGTPLANKC